MSVAIRRPLTEQERALARSVFGDAIDYDPVRIVDGKWIFFQPAGVAMAPMGHIHFHPKGGVFRADFAAAPLSLQGLFIHEMTHVWQAQTRGRWWLPLMRHPFCRYDYSLRAGWPLHRYGIEQQATIVQHAFLARHGQTAPGAPPRSQLESVLPFRS
ncbi:hypothetical protein GGR88_000473 [Sphingomonas jejuensis]|uniref:Vgr related protein n=1 Tax=Sphingomonas jejuensis TaxID=904715 RepID=A0ABX0XI43_9SPHN|nr:vgr related protein [Sphingomonas jejuensis]NJC32999.1 hypothetical protein [Sphingomonas jejuensis]